MQQYTDWPVSHRLALSYQQADNTVQTCCLCVWVEGSLLCLSQCIAPTHTENMVTLLAKYKTDTLCTLHKGMLEWQHLHCVNMSKTGLRKVVQLGSPAKSCCSLCRLQLACKAPQLPGSHAPHTAPLMMNQQHKQRMHHLFTSAAVICQLNLCVTLVGL